MLRDLGNRQQISRGLGKEPHSAWDVTRGPAAFARRVRHNAAEAQRDPSTNLDCSINSASMHQDSDVDRIPHREVPRAVGMHMIACTADARIRYELGFHRAGGRIGGDGIEVDYVVE
jgi:hypothetical protein